MIYEKLIRSALLICTLGIPSLQIVNNLSITIIYITPDQVASYIFFKIFYNPTGFYQDK